MRILQIATLITPTGAFGGPVRVAENQCAALIANNHDVILAAGTAGFDRVPERIGRAPARLFPARRVLPFAGFSGVAAPGLQAWLRRNLSSFDAVHVHLGRDLVTLPAARAALKSGVPLIVQPHGMILPSGNPLARPLDATWTRRTLRAANAVLYLTEAERCGLASVESRSALQFLPNGVPDVPVSESFGAAQEEPEVLYLSRLHPRKQPEIFVRAALKLLARGVNARFTIAGPDEGLAGPLQEMIRSSGESRIRMEGAVDPRDVLDRMRRASLFVLPSVNEPFPMAVLEAMSVGIPVIVSTTCGLAPHVVAANAGFVITPNEHQLADVVAKALGDRQALIERGRSGRDYVRKNLSMGAVVEQLQDLYAHVELA